MHLITLHPLPLPIYITSLRDSLGLPNQFPKGVLSGLNQPYLPFLVIPFPSLPSLTLSFFQFLSFSTKKMASSSSRDKSSGPVLRSLSPSGRFCSYTTSRTPFSTPSSAFASSTSSSFSSPSSAFFSQPNHHHYNHHHHHHHNSHHRSASPTRVNLYTPVSLSSGVRFSIDSRSISPNRTISNQIITKNNRHISVQKKTCMCSPTSHPGSFRCSLHKNTRNNNSADSFPSNHLNMRRSAMKNSLVRIGGVEGEWVKRALTALIRPSSHQQRRRAAFEPRPSRLSVMSKAEDL